MTRVVGHRNALAAGLVVASVVLLPGSAFAGDGNVLYLTQTSPSSFAGGEGFLSDQTASTNSSIGSEWAPARQSGQKDSASIAIDSNCLAVSHDCGHVDLTQDANFAEALAGNPWAPLVEPLLTGLSGHYGGNTATVTVTGQGSGTVSQYGFGNQASISVNADNKFADSPDASISQIGLNNQATLSVTLFGSSAGPTAVGVSQLGVNNKANMQVSVQAGQSVSYSQVGLGLTHGSALTPVVVQTTGSVSITQTNFGIF